MRPYCSSKLGIQMVIYVAFVIESTTALGGIFGLKALTGNTPYTGLGNPWITYPRIANGGGIANSYLPSWIYGSGGIFNGYGTNTDLIHHPYRQYFQNYFGSQQPLLQNPLNILSNSLTTAASLGGGPYYRGSGNPWIIQQ